MLRRLHLKVVDKKAIVARIKAIKGGAKTRKTFTVDPILYAKFVKECDKQGIKMSNAVEDFMKDFIGE